MYVYIYEIIGQDGHYNNRAMVNLYLRYFLYICTYNSKILAHYIIKQCGSESNELSVSLQLSFRSNSHLFLELSSYSIDIYY